MELNSFCIDNYRDFVCVEISCVILCRLLLIMQDLSESTTFNLQGLFIARMLLGIAQEILGPIRVIEHMHRCWTEIGPTLQTLPDMVHAMSHDPVLLFDQHGHGRVHRSSPYQAPFSQRSGNVSCGRRRGQSDTCPFQDACPCSCRRIKRGLGQSPPVFAKVEWKIRVHLSVYRVACIIEKEEVVELDCREFVWQRSGAYCSRRSFSIAVYQVSQMSKVEVPKSASSPARLAHTGLILDIDGVKTVSLIPRHHL
ncbi:hypothetical protein KCU75_g30, partial [Aureobasidium melanogenum]